MKREGRQHGMVRTFRILPSPLNPRPNTRFITRFDSPPTAGLFTKVPSKPTNHSKFTGKCGAPRCTSCNLHPVCKSKNKTKGNQKQKHLRVMDQPDLKFSGLSATMMLDRISNSHVDVDDDGYDDEVEDESGDHVDYYVSESYILGEGGDCANDDDDDDCGKCLTQVGLPFHIEQVDDEKYEDEDWCLVESSS